MKAQLTLEVKEPEDSEFSSLLIRLGKLLSFSEYHSPHLCYDSVRHQLTELSLLLFHSTTIYQSPAMSQALG